MTRKSASLWLVPPVLLLAGCNTQKKPAMAGPPPAVPVSVAQAVQQPMPVEIRAVGTAEPVHTVQVKSQIAGELMRVDFTEGGQVNQGDLLFEIDPRPFQEALRQAEAALARDTALLRQSEANLGRDRAQLRNAEADAERYAELNKERVVARSQYDQYRTAADAQRESVRADEAAIESARAAVDSDRAAIEKAKLDLSYCRILSPVSGRAGNLLVHTGNLVKANGDNALVVINQIEPIFVSFGVPEEHLSAIRQRAAGGRKLPVQLTLDQSDKTLQGDLTVIDNAVDSATGTIRLKAVFANREHAIWPGQFVNVALMLDTQADAIVVPSEAVQAGQKGQFLYVVKADQSVDLRPVQVGRTSGGKAVIAAGVKAGETVVTDGQLRLFPGARIQAVPASKIDSQAL